MRQHQLPRVGHGAKEKRCGQVSLGDWISGGLFRINTIHCIGGRLDGSGSQIIILIVAFVVIVEGGCGRY